MNKQELFENIIRKKSFLCIGLDTDTAKIPVHLLNSDDPIFEFNKAIIDATSDLCVAYKPNIAFYESCGARGWESLARTLDYIPDDIFTIADAKRGDIGNSSAMYAKTFFEIYNFDSVTLSPYMGKDSVLPFFGYENKWSILLGVTSNSGAEDFQFSQVSSGECLYLDVMRKSKDWGTVDNTMYVVGATRPELLTEIRKIIPDHFLLIPGVGAQGGNLEEIAKTGLNDQCGLLVNSSRGIIYASNGEDFAEKAREKALEMQQQMSGLLNSISSAVSDK